MKKNEETSPTHHLTGYSINVLHMPWSVLLRGLLLLTTASALLQTPPKATRFKFPFHPNSQGPLVGRPVTLESAEGVTKAACFRKCARDSTCIAVVAQNLDEGRVSCVHFTRQALVKQSTLKMCKPKVAPEKAPVCKYGKRMNDGACVCRNYTEGQHVEYLKPDHCNYESWQFFFEKTVIYRGRFYLLSLHPITSWAKAQEVCGWYGGYLAEIDDEAEHVFVSNAPYTWKGTTAFFWMGGSDENEEGTWLFPRTGKPVGFLRWNAGEPNNIGVENCQAFVSYHKHKPNFFLFDFPCKGYLRFICEIPFNS